MRDSHVTILLTMLDVASVALKAFPEAYAAYILQKELLSKIVEEQRDPTPAEWKELLNQVQKNTDILND